MIHAFKRNQVRKCAGKGKTMKKTVRNIRSGLGTQHKVHGRPFHRRIKKQAVIQDNSFPEKKPVFIKIIPKGGQSRAILNISGFHRDDIRGFISGIGQFFLAADHGKLSDADRLANALQLDAIDLNLLLQNSHGITGKLCVEYFLCGKYAEQHLESAHVEQFQNRRGRPAD